MTRGQALRQGRRRFAGSPTIGAGLALVEPPGGEQEVNLDYAATTPALRVTLEAVAGFLPHYGSVHRGGGRRSASSTDAYERARDSVARFVGCPEGCSAIFVRNTTEAANVLAAALPAGSLVLCTPFEHHANLLPWRIHDVSHLPFTRSAEELVFEVGASLAAASAAGRPVDLLAVSGASNVTGEVTPVAELAAMAHRYGARVFVDAAQLAPHRSIDVREAGIDFLAFSGHKLYAPFGVGALIVRDEVLADGLPLLRGGGAVRLVSLDDVAWSPLPHRYEAGTPNTVGAVALGAACRALADHGMERIRESEQQLSERLWGRARIDPGNHSAAHVGGCPGQGRRGDVHGRRPRCERSRRRALEPVQDRRSQRCVLRAPTCRRLARRPPGGDGRALRGHLPRRGDPSAGSSAGEHRDRRRYLRRRRAARCPRADRDGPVNRGPGRTSPPHRPRARRVQASERTAS